MTTINRRGLLLGGLGVAAGAAGAVALDTAAAAPAVAAASAGATVAQSAAPSSAAGRALAAGSAGVFNPFLRQSTLYSYGHSFTVVPSPYCTPDRGEYPLRLKELIGFADVVPFGRGATYLPDTLALALNGIRATDKDRTWPGLATIASSEHAHGVNNDPDHRSMPRGVVTIQNYLNETGDTHPWAHTPEYVEFWSHCLRSLIAVVSSKGQKASTVDVGSTAPGGHAWQTMSSAQYVNMFPGGHLFRSNQVGDWRQFRVSGDECWILIFAALSTTATRGLDVYVGNTKIQEIDPTGMMAPYTSVIADSAGLNLWPLAVRVTGLNAAAGTADFKTVQVRVANRGSGWGFLSTALFPRKTPPEVFVAYEPVRRNVTDWPARTAMYRAAIDQVVSEFTNVHAVDLEDGWDLEAMTLAGDIHPNDRGQVHIADRFVEAINDNVTDFTNGIAII
ncbi:hypothetical protein H4J02_01880 [Protaetiibacter sp. SSC-01]|uniref:hypothetical protein n=1 Tax=Protaetiibacter sp. SSC-01 TaxID=2759943 RepID=UPI001656D11E|nr:hypothetical protein [Protaetiibacter sp. SSC-01]QNO37816.1 hypothetical protein H4J02_01880 [Protaetiibacter sp. SSC-01]